MNIESSVKLRSSSSTSGSSRKRRRSPSPADEEEENDSSNQTQDSSLSPWPEKFLGLMRVFQSLNTVFTFCCTRKHFPTTFENLKVSVENLTGR